MLCAPICIISVLSSSYLYDKQISHSVATNCFNVIFAAQSWHINNDVDTKKIYIYRSVNFSHITERSCEPNGSCKAISQQCNGSCTQSGSNAAIKCTHRSRRDGEGERERGKAIQTDFKSIQPQKTPNRNLQSTCGHAALWAHKIWCFLSINLKKKTSKCKVQS